MEMRSMMDGHKGRGAEEKERERSTAERGDHRTWRYKWRYRERRNERC
jgi:hypothetical protein